MSSFDSLWDYNHPAETENKFRGVLYDLSPETNLSEYLQLLTQIARTYSLRAMYDDAHRQLDEVEQQLPAENDLAKVRYHLERGRTYRSSGKKEESLPHFEQAKTLSAALQEDFHTLDAIHMLAIIAPPEQGILLNEEAIRYAENSKQERAKNWLGSLYNNLGWSYFERGEYDKALDVFQRALKFREEKKAAPEIFLAKWCIARTLRALGLVEEAFNRQIALFGEAIKNGAPDGYVHEELGELFLLQGKIDDAKKHFQEAYELLSTDVFLQQNEAARLERIKQLSA